MTTKEAKEFIFYLHTKQYFEAHEVLEDIWFPQRFHPTNEIKLLKGFINAAVALELYKRGRVVQSKRVWANYLKYRQLLYKVIPTQLNIYHYLAREIEQTYKKVTKNS